MGFGFISHLFYPWGFILQILALVHFFRRRPDGFWIFVIFFGGAIGALVYMAVEVLPDVGLLRGAFASHGRKSRIHVVLATVAENPSVANLEELGELYFDEQQYPAAREAFDRAIKTRSDSPHSFYRRGVCAVEMNDFAAAIPDLETAVRADTKMDSYRAEMFLAQAYAAAGRGAEATTMFDDAVARSNTPEMLYNYAAFLKSQNRIADAREWVGHLFEKKKSLPRYMQRIERPWFRKGETLSKDLRAS
jgi:hypothetical protein